MGGAGWAFSWGEQDDNASIGAIHAALDKGINWIDTAPVYGLGHSEEVVAEALQGIPKSERPYVFTKCGLLGDAKNPMLVACRSGARDSMPGMMDTVLNIGLNDTTVEALAKNSGNKRFALDSYRRLLLPYAKVAQKYGAATFTVGTELDSMEGDPHWAGLIAAVGRVFGGQISYDINWSDYITTPQVDVPVGSFGVDAYFPVDAPDSAPVSELVAGWDAWLDHKTTGPLRSLVFSEVAIGAEDGAYESPGNFYVSNPYNPNVQANWYTAICTVTRQRQMAGMYVWSLDFNAVPDHPPRSESPLDFLGRPLSEQALRACFSGELASADAHTGLPGGQHIEISRYGDPLRHRSTVP